MLLSVSWWDFRDVCVLECLNQLVLGFHASQSLKPFSLFIVSGFNFICTAPLKSQSMQPDILASTSVSRVLVRWLDSMVSATEDLSS
jgi:hypothetical protein